MLLLSLITAFLNLSQASPLSPLKVAIIDTGFGYKTKTWLYGDPAHLCKSEHEDFSGENHFKDFGNIKHVPVDTVGHGTNITGIISEHTTNPYYCIVIIKYYSESSNHNMDNSIKAIEYANKIGADIINYSGGGPSPNDQEKEQVLRFLNHGGKIFAAAGNDGKKLNKNNYSYYPAMYDILIRVVGNKYKTLDGLVIKSESSNYGDVVNDWEFGEDVMGNGLKLSGTSQATALATSKYLSNRETESRNK